MIDALRHGRRNAKTLAQLCSATGIASREAQLLIEEARRDGVPVLSCSDGYFLASSPDEARLWEDAQRRRIKSMVLTLKGVRKWRRGVESGPQMGLGL